MSLSTIINLLITLTYQNFSMSSFSRTFCVNLYAIERVMIKGKIFVVES